MIPVPVFVAQSLVGGRIEHVTTNNHRQAIDMAKTVCKTYSLSAVIRRDNIPGGYVEYECYKEKTLLEWLAPLAQPSGDNVAAPVVGQSDVWRPTDEQVSDLEAAIKLPTSYPNLSEYARYYVAYGSNGRHEINGELLHLPQYRPGIYMVSDESKFPNIADGGCGVMHISYDFDVHRLASRPKCNPIR